MYDYVILMSDRDIIDLDIISSIITKFPDMSLIYNSNIKDVINIDVETDINIDVESIKKIIKLFESLLKKFLMINKYRPYIILNNNDQSTTKMELKDHLTAELLQLENISNEASFEVDGFSILLLF